MPKTPKQLTFLRKNILVYFPFLTENSVHTHPRAAHVLNPAML